MPERLGLHDIVVGGRTCARPLVEPETAHGADALGNGQGERQATAVTQQGATPER
jgi:hypothetical protein